MSYGRNNIFGKFIVWVLIIGAISAGGYYLIFKTIIKALDGHSTQRSEIVKNVQDSNGNSLGKPGDPPCYIIDIEVKQATATLDIGEHIKNGMNSCVLRVMVDKRYYDGVEIGQDLKDSEMKFGSLLFDGDASWLKFTVVSKMVIEFKPLEETVVDTVKVVTLQPDTI